VVRRFALARGPSFQLAQNRSMSAGVNWSISTYPRLSAYASICLANVRYLRSVAGARPADSRWVMKTWQASSIVMRDFIGAGAGSGVACTGGGAGVPVHEPAFS